MIRLIICFALLGFTVPAFSQSYSWKDSNGVNFTDNMNNIPKKYLWNAKVVYDNGTSEPVKSLYKSQKEAAIEAENQRKEAAEKKKEEESRYNNSYTRSSQGSSSYGYSGSSGNLHTLENCQTACGALFSTSPVEYSVCVRDCRP